MAKCDCDHCKLTNFVLELHDIATPEGGAEALANVAGLLGQMLKNSDQETIVSCLEIVAQELNRDGGRGAVH